LTPVALKQMDILDRSGKVVGKQSLPKGWEGEVNTALLWQAVRMYRTNRRQGTVKTKDRGEVSGGGRKPWKQKHTGRARQGSIRAPQWRGGGVVFGPTPKDYRIALSQTVRRQALSEGLKQKLEAERLRIVDRLEELEPKTKALASVLKSLSVTGGVLLVVEKHDPTLVRIARNIPGVSVRSAAELNCYDVLAAPQLVLTAGAVKALGGRAEESAS